MAIHPKIKHLTISLRVLLNDVIDFNHGSIFGIQAMHPDILQLWEDYNSIRLSILSENLVSPLRFPELYYPEPDIANGDSFYKEGTMIYKPEHFIQLRHSIEDMLAAIRLSDQKESA